MGGRRYQHSLKKLISVLEYPELNKHLIYHILDIVFAALVPELSLQADDDGSQSLSLEQEIIWQTISR